MTTINCRDHQTIFVPQEVCGLICQELQAMTGTKRELLPLCSVASGFREEVERLMYVSVGLQGKDNILSFCSAVNHRPDLVARTRKLVMAMPPQMCFDEAEFFAISQTLHASTALEDLRVLCQNSRQIGISMNTWILEGHAFKLVTFVNTYFHSKWLKAFLTSQPTIQTLGDDQLETNSFWNMPFPKLKILRCTLEGIEHCFLNTPTGIIERLFVNYRSPPECFPNYLEWVNKRFGETLKCISIAFLCTSYNIRAAVHIVRTAMATLPNVKFIEIIAEFSGTPMRDGFSSLDDLLLPPLPKTVQLETVVLHPPTPLRFDGVKPRRGVDETERRFLLESWKALALSTEEGRLSAAASIMQHIPAKRLVLTNDGNRYEYIREYGNVSSVGDAQPWMPSVVLSSLSDSNALDAAEWLNVSL
ncbi:hypothetical protein BDN70DRAFT_930990 [Pholiota conissans]|uniref:Uncharacterized protein n=1 Tax=Pholiota conissans TaxID=109636 RepID=A0A9P6D365_9AGAR|nr:hypothetical protein BDN70DRAFT_930990 [Pholiota conissans]